MAHAAVNWVITELQFPEAVKPPARWLLVHIADRADKDTWTCYPSHKTLAKDAGMSSRSVLSLLQILEDHRLIRRTARLRENGTRTSDLITLLRYEESCAPEDDGPHQPQVLRGGAEKAAAQNLVTEPRKGTDVVVAREADLDPFEQWWPHYPRRVAKAGARKAFWAALPKFKCDTPLTALIEATDRFAEEVRGREIEKIPHPATWLNGERWNDEPQGNGGPTDGRGSPASSSRFDRAAERHRSVIEPMLAGAVEAVNRRRRWGVGD